MALTAKAAGGGIRGLHPAGVECWNGVRGIDYLSSLPEVDPERIAVTGIKRRRGRDFLDRLRR